MNAEAIENQPIQLSRLDTLLMGIFGERPDQHPNPNANLLYNLAQELPLKILLAEDRPTDCTIALRVLRSLGYQADSVNNGVEALVALRRKHYDVLLTDVQMPQMGGLELARHLCQQWTLEERPCIIAVTSEVMPEIREQCLKVGMDECISKPPKVEELTQALRKCQFRRAGNESD